MENEINYAELKIEVLEDDFKSEKKRDKLCLVVRERLQ